MIYFLIPTYNEELNIPNLAKELLNALPGEEKHFVFSDDGSTDRTREQIQEHFSKAKFEILGDGINRGPGYVFNVGFEWILKHSQQELDRIITMEADCTSDVSLLPNMLAISRLNYDLVLASVYAQGGGFDKTSWLRKLVSATANLTFRALFNVKVLTLSSFYRVYHPALLKRIKQNNTSIISERGFICMLEILVKSIEQNACVIEVPMVLHSQKRQGKSKLKMLKTTLAYLRFLVLRKR